jgi:hypothetical protein
VRSAPKQPPLQTESEKFIFRDISWFFIANLA